MKKHSSMILIAVMVIGYLAIGRQSAKAGIPPTNGCDEFSRTTKKLCIKYCEKLECDEEIPHYQVFRRWLCGGIRYKIIRKTGSDPPCEVDPCADFGPDPCLCEFDQVPMTPECWGGCTNCSGSPDFLPFEGNDPNFDLCRLQQLIDITGTPRAGFELFFTASGGVITDRVCQRINFVSTSCTFDDVTVGTLSPQQFSRCQCELERYADNLEGVQGIIINGGAPPFSCEPPMP